MADLPPTFPNLTPEDKEDMGVAALEGVTDSVLLARLADVGIVPGGGGGGGGGPTTAAQVSYDNGASGLPGTNAQAALDELAVLAIAAANKTLSNVTDQNLTTRLAAVGITPGGGGGGPIGAGAVTYSNIVSGLSAGDVQDAIDELALETDALTASLTGKLNNNWSNMDGSATTTALQGLGFQPTGPSVPGLVQWGVIAGKAWVPIKAFAKYGIPDTGNHTQLINRAIASGQQVLLPPLGFTSGGAVMPYNVEYLELVDGGFLQGFDGMTLIQQVADAGCTFLSLKAGQESFINGCTFQGIILHGNRSQQTKANPRGMVIRSYPSKDFSGQSPWKSPDPLWRLTRLYGIEIAGTGVALYGRGGAGVFDDILLHNIGPNQLIGNGDESGFSSDMFDIKVQGWGAESTAGRGMHVLGTWGATMTVEKTKFAFNGFDQRPGSTINAKGRYPGMQIDAKNCQIKANLQDQQGDGLRVTAGGGSYEVFCDGVNNALRNQDAAYFVVDGTYGDKMGGRYVLSGSEQNTSKAPHVMRLVGGARKNIMSIANYGSAKGVPTYTRSMIKGALLDNVTEYNGIKLYG